MKELNIGCKRVSDGVIVAGVFLSAALVMMLVARYLVPEIPLLLLLLKALGALLLLFVPVVLVTTWLRHLSHRQIGRISTGH